MNHASRIARRGCSSLQNATSGRTRRWRFKTQVKKQFFRQIVWILFLRKKTFLKFRQIENWTFILLNCKNQFFRQIDWFFLREKNIFKNFVKLKIEHLFLHWFTSNWKLSNYSVVFKTFFFFCQIDLLFFWKKNPIFEISSNRKLYTSRTTDPVYFWIDFSRQIELFVLKLNIFNNFHQNLKFQVTQKAKFHGVWKSLCQVESIFDVFSVQSKFEKSSFGIWRWFGRRP